MQLKRTTEYGMPGTLLASRQEVAAGLSQSRAPARSGTAAVATEDGVHERGDGEHRHPLEQLEPRAPATRPAR